MAPKPQPTSDVSSPPHHVLAGRTALGAIWLFASRIVTRLIDFIALLILAKLLTPSDFGLVAIASSVVMIADAASEFPIGQALLRLPELTEDHFNTAFTFGLLRGLALCAILALAAAPVSALFHEPRLAPLIIFLCLAPLARGLVSPKMTHYARQISFNRDFIIETASKLSALALSTAAAILTHSYWAVAIASTSSAVCVTALSYGFAPYRPRLSLSAWRGFLSFVGWSTGAQVITVVNWQSDRFLLGRYIPRGSLGEYSMADTISSLPDQVLINSTTRPLLAAFTHVRSDDGQLRSAYIVASATVLSVGLPFLIVASLLAGPIVHLLLGPVWTGAAPILSLLILSNVARLVTAPLLPMAMALNQTRIFFTRSLLEVLVKLPVLFFAILHYGVMGAVWVRLAMSLYNGAVETVLLKRILEFRLKDQLLPLWKTFAAAAAMALVIGLFTRVLKAEVGLMLWVTTGVTALAGLIAYAGTLTALWIINGRPAGFEKAIATRLTPTLSKLKGMKIYK